MAVSAEEQKAAAAGALSAAKAFGEAYPFTRFNITPPSSSFTAKSKLQLYNGFGFMNFGKDMIAFEHADYPDLVY
jgi:hypothetical protein